MTPMTFAERLQSRLKAKGWTNSHLVVALSEAGLPVHENSVSRWVNGSRQPRFEYIPALADALDVTTDWLLGRQPAATGTEG